MRPTVKPIDRHNERALELAITYHASHPANWATATEIIDTAKKFAGFLLVQKTTLEPRA